MICEHCGIEIDAKAIPVKPSLKREPRGPHRIALVGEAPGRQEAFHGTPFVGESGKLLRATLKASGLDDAEIYFTNVLCHRPPDNRTPTQAEVNKGLPRLLLELEHFAPTTIIAVGNTAVGALLGENSVKITEIRGTRYRRDLGWGPVRIVPTLHPAAVLRKDQDFPDFARDLERCLDDELITCPDVVLLSTSSDLAAVIAGARKQGMTRVAYDIETTGFDYIEDRIISIGFAFDDQIGYIIPDTAVYQNDVVALLRRFAADPFFEFVGHNAISFDYSFLDIQLGAKFHVALDTMLAHYLCDERVGTHGLKRITRDFYHLPDYSAAIKKYVKEEGTTYADIPRNELYQYQAWDVVVTWRFSYDVEKWMREENVLRTYKDLIDPAAWMIREIEFNGCPVDRNRLDSIVDVWQAQLDTYRNELALQAGNMDLNVRSHVQLSKVLYDELQLPVLAVSKAGNRATGKDVLAKLEPADETGFIHKVVQTRSLAQNIATYGVGIRERLSKDGRIRPHLLLHVTGTGRLACVAEGTSVQLVDLNDNVPTIKEVPVEQVAPGDLAVSYTDDGTAVLSEVLQAGQVDRRSVVRVRWVDDETGESGYTDMTDDHLVRLRTGVYVPAITLSGGDELTGGGIHAESGLSGGVTGE
jgi:uracil-DNA glycosylase family 4